MRTDYEWQLKIETRWMSVQIERGYLYLRLFRWDFERG